MEPIPESLEALSRLSATTKDDLVQGVQTAADLVAQAVPDCIGLSVTHFDAGLTFTLVATDERLRILDAAQYLEGGPCQDAALTGEEIRVDELMNEDRWQLLAIASAAQGVKSSVSLPLRHNGQLYGSVNVYGATPDAFSGRERELAVLFGVAVSEAVANADLSMTSLHRARQAVKSLDAEDTLHRATGYLAAKEALSVEEANSRLQEAAARAGISAVALAELVLEGRDVDSNF